MRSDVATAARRPARRRDDGHAVNTTLVVLELDGILIPLPLRSTERSVSRHDELAQDAQRPLRLIIYH